MSLPKPMTDFDRLTDEQREKWQDGKRREVQREQRASYFNQFPFKGKFESLDEVEAYHGQATIMCLRCGEHHARLHSHILHRHGMTCDEYRTEYNLPHSASLMCRPALESLKQIAHDQVDAGVRNFSTRNMDPERRRLTMETLNHCRGAVRQPPSYVHRDHAERRRKKNASAA